jgi:hypothetical protein
MGQQPHFHINTAAGYHKLCETPLCGQLSDCVWDSDDSEPVALCAACYVDRAHKTITRLLAENREDTLETRLRLLVMSNSNKFPTYCCDCGTAVPPRAGHMAWTVLSGDSVVVCQACTDDRMAGLHDKRKLF